MFLSFKALEQSGVEVKPRNNGVELLPTQHWSEQAIEWFEQFSAEIQLTDRDRDEVSEFVCDLTLMKVIKDCLTTHYERGK